MFESVDALTHARFNSRTPARVPSYKLTLWAFGSGELKIYVFRVSTPKKLDRAGRDFFFLINAVFFSVNDT